MFRSCSRKMNIALPQQFEQLVEPAALGAFSVRPSVKAIAAARKHPARFVIRR